MSDLKKVHDHLPFVRRYARALAGSQKQGDALVLATLQALVNSPPVVSEDQTKIRLYETLSRLWNSAAGEDINLGRSQLMPETAVDARLSSLTANSRQAFLLTAMESFSVPEAAQILRLSTGAFEAALLQARKEISEQVKTDVLIIEDELFIAVQLEALVKDMGHTIVGIERTQATAVARAQSQPPGLILADIHLADSSSGIDAVKDILAKHDVPVIFITAYPERLLTGKRPEPTYLITKPFQDDHVRAVISQAIFFINTPQVAART